MRFLTGLAVFLLLSVSLSACRAESKVQDDDEPLSTQSTTDEKKETHIDEEKEQNSGEVGSDPDEVKGQESGGSVSVTPAPATPTPAVSTPAGTVPDGVVPVDPAPAGTTTPDETVPDETVPDDPVPSETTPAGGEPEPSGSPDAGGSGAGTTDHEQDTGNELIPMPVS